MVRNTPQTNMHPFRLVLWAIALVVGVILIMRNFSTPTTIESTQPAQVQSAPQSQVQAMDIPSGSHRDLDGHVRVDAPPGWLSMPDCKSDGLRTWTHEDASGNITYYCKK